MKTLWILAILCTSFVVGQNQLQAEDIKILLGDWKGSLTYVDYSSNQPFTMPANLSVAQGENAYQFVLSNLYPNEPKANGDDLLTLSKDGTKLNEVDILTVDRLEPGFLKITTAFIGQDNNKTAQIRVVYHLSKQTFNIRKEVKFEEAEDWMMRSEFKYTR